MARISPRLAIGPLSVPDACQYARSQLGHEFGMAAYRFAIGVRDVHGHLVAVAIAGRPTKRRVRDTRTVEIVVALGATPRLWPALLAQVKTTAHAMGYRQMVTTIPGGVLPAQLYRTGWRQTASRRGGHRRTAPSTHHTPYGGPKVETWAIQTTTASRRETRSGRRRHRWT